MSEIEARLAAGEVAGTGSNWEEIRTSLLRQADREGAIDLAYERHDTPFGTMVIVAGEGGILRIALAAEPETEVLTDLARRGSPRIGRTGRDALTDARRQLDDYFGGELRTFDLPLDWRLTRGFRREVLHETAAIPYGATASYAQMARQAGSPRAVRAAGSALATNPLPIVVPCHRVLRSDGAVGSYLGGSPMKESLLKMERERTAA